MGGDAELKNDPWSTCSQDESYTYSTETEKDLNGEGLGEAMGKESVNVRK